MGCFDKHSPKKRPPAHLLQMYALKLSKGEDVSIIHFMKAHAAKKKSKEKPKKTNETTSKKKKKGEEKDVEEFEADFPAEFSFPASPRSSKTSSKATPSSSIKASKTSEAKPSIFDIPDIFQGSGVVESKLSDHEIPDVSGSEPEEDEDDFHEAKMSPDVASPSEEDGEEELGDDEEGSDDEKEESDEATESSPEILRNVLKKKSSESSLPVYEKDNGDLLNILVPLEKRTSEPKLFSFDPIQDLDFSVPSVPPKKDTPFSAPAAESDAKNKKETRKLNPSGSDSSGTKKSGQEVSPKKSIKRGDTEMPSSTKKDIPKKMISDSSAVKTKSIKKTDWVEF